MGVNDVDTDLRSDAVDREPEMRAQASTESKSQCEKENDGVRTGKRPKIECKRIEHTPTRSDNNKSTVKKKSSTPSIALFLSNSTERDKHRSLAQTKKKSMDCCSNDVGVVFVGDSNGVKGGDDDGNVDKKKSKQQLEAVSIKGSFNNELPEDKRSYCQSVADMPTNKKVGVVCVADTMTIDDDDEGGRKEKGRMQSTSVHSSPLTPGKKRVKVMVIENEKENHEQGGQKSDVSVITLDAKQDVETPKSAAVTDDEDCSEGGSVEEVKSKFSKHNEILDTCNKMETSRSTTIVVPAVGMTPTPESKDDMYISLRQNLGEGGVDTTSVTTPQKISTTTTDDSSSSSTPATTIGAQENDGDTIPSPSLKPPPSSKEVKRSPVANDSSGGGLSTEILHYELQLEEAISLFEKTYKERPDEMLGFDEAIDYAIQDEEKKLKLKDEQQCCKDIVSGGGSSSESASLSSFPNVLCPALCSIIQGDGSRLDNLTSMAFQVITGALERLLSDETKSAAADTLLENVSEANITEKIQLLAMRRTYGNPPPKATVVCLADKTPLACWIWEVQCIEVLPGNKLNQTIVRRARADRKKVGDWVKSLCRLLTTLENHSLDTARVATDKEKAMKCARAIETATQKKRALELAQERKFQENEEREKEKLEKEKQRVAKQETVRARREAREAEKDAKMDAKRQKVSEKLQVTPKGKTDEKPKVSLLNFFSKKTIASPRTVDLSGTAVSCSSTNGLVSGGSPPSALGLNTGTAAHELTEAAAVYNMKDFRANIFSNMPFDELLAKARQLDRQSGKHRACGYCRGRSKRIKLEVHVEGAPPTPGRGSFADVTYVEPKQVCVRGPMKALQFHEDLRPAYWGTCSGSSRVVSGRRPMAKDVSILDYSVDSEAEWEDEPEGGEELVSEEDEGGPGLENEPDGLDYDDGWLKHDEDALIFSGDEGEGDSNNECDNSANPTDPKYAAFQISQNRSIVGVRYIEDGQMVLPSTLAQQRAVVLAVDDGEPIPAEAARDGKHYAFVSSDTHSTTLKSSAVDSVKAAISVDQPKGGIEKKTGKPKPFLPSHLPLLVKILHGNPCKKDTIISDFISAHPEVGKKALNQMITSIATKETSINKSRVWVVKEPIFQQLNSANNEKKEDREGVPPVDQLSPLKGQKSLRDFVDPAAIATAQSKT